VSPGIRPPAIRPGLTLAGGHTTSPYEQKTQQPPASGRRVAPHAGQDQKNRQRPVGISTGVSVLHSGHVRGDTDTVSDMARLVGSDEIDRRFAFV